ncbi:MULTISPECIES: YggT family protein [Francisella]|uniref:YGGT family protein n=4 Tax=Francisella TaxID=262 RepID=A0AAW3DB08_9GAMM|nr:MULTISPECIES: YggT family protein [Francisella]AEI35073.1 Integral membrane protein YggT, involved in response to extracytoplasmic stress (osmotic shock) [Francisella salina]KFJ42691.1 YGGT family protein [Francisella philomiragia]MBK2092838.1 YggT family protein [Francisella philomiragia]MBK2095804.1 YggT family protein [Francisella philomiragia]MBK2253901.1 YggT family protein [Francisella philomiragia]
MLNGLINVATFLIDIVFGIYAFILLFRFFLQWVKADFYNPICQMIMRATNAAILPLRKFIPGFLNLDWSCIVAVYIVFVVQDLLVGLLNGIGLSLMFIFFKPLIDIVFAVINMYVYLIIIRAISSWFVQGGYNPIIMVIYQVTEPLLSRARNIIKPTNSGFDFSPIIVLIGLFCIQIFIQSIIAQFFHY